MSPEDVDINLNSLALVREELEATIQRAAGEFEAYLLDPNNTDALQNCQGDIAQVGGTLRLIQFSGAALLADEMAAAANDAGSAEGPAAEALAGTLSHAFFALPRYIEFVATRHFAQPLLILPFVNELRVARRQPLVPEFHFERRPLPQSPSAALPVAEGASREALARLRQMFQVGLLAILKQQNEATNLQLLARASARFALQTPAGSGGGIWHLAAAATAALAAGGLTLNINRRRTLGAVERLMARYIKGGEAALTETAADQQLRRELVFMLALSAHREGIVQTVIAAFGIPTLAPNDRELGAQREAMRGPGIEAIDSVVKVLKEELRGAKDILEIGAQNQGIAADDLAPLQDTLSRVADTLRMVNLRAPGEMLRAQLAVVKGWAQTAPGGVPVEQFLGVADALLFIESSLSSLYRNELTAADLEQVSDAMRRQIVADSQLAEASRIVIDEAQAGIALAKRAITAYVESNFDLIHITNVAVTLNGVRGGLQILEHRRAAVILKNCAVFIDGYIHDKQHNSPQRHQLLETLADALISMEYYLTELAAGRKPDAKILIVAEESLTALGFTASGGA